jgi:hypothetical protein
MPYKLRKAPKRDLYWVVNKETGKKYSNEPLPKEKAKAQMRALYVAEKKEGGAKQYLEAPVGSKRMSAQRFAAINQNVADFFAPMERIKYAKENPKSIRLPAEKGARKMMKIMLRSSGIDPNTVADEAKGEVAETTPPDSEIPSLRGDNRTTPDETKYTKMTKEDERKILYGEGLYGEGFFGDIWSATKRVASKVVSRVRDVSKGIRYDFSPSVRDLLAKVGNRPVVQAYVRRDPIVSLLNTALNFISRGKWNEVRAKYNYDKLFHLGLEVVIKVSDTDDILARYVIEKNEVISITPGKAFKQDTEIMEVPLTAGITINALLAGAKKVMGDKFYPYDPFHNNCQDFIMAILHGSGLATPGLTQFVKQPIEGVISELPGYTGKVAKIITDLGGLANVAMEGRGMYGYGGYKPNPKFANQLKKAGVSPAEYLLEARRKAKKLGLAYKHLGFSDNDKQKLQIPNADGSLVRFGAVGLGDHILYTLAKDPKADEHRKHYLQRATKIRGDWKKDEYSPNSLAIGVLW